MSLRWIALMAWRGAFRVPRRSALALVTIAAGLLVLIFLRGVQDGYIAQRIESVVRMGAGHARIVPTSADATFLPDAHAALARARRISGVLGASERLRFEGYLHGPGGDGGAQILAFRPDDETRVTDLPALFDRDGARPGTIALGRELARRLGVSPGQEVAVLARSAAGPPAADRFRAAILRPTGVALLDAHAAFLDLDAARALLGTPGSATEIALRLRDPARLPETVALWRTRGSPGTRLSSWEEQTPEVKQMIGTMRLAEKLRGGVVFALVGLAIANLMSLSVLERRREFGLLLALGVAPVSLLALVFLESLCLGAVGVALGCALGAGITGAWLGTSGIDLSLFGPDLRAALGADAILYPIVTASNLLTASAWVFLVSAVVTLPAAARLLRLDPVEAIRRP